MNRKEQMKSMLMAAVVISLTAATSVKQHYPRSLGSWSGLLFIINISLYFRLFSPFHVLFVTKDVPKIITLCLKTFFKNLGTPIYNYFFRTLQPTFN